MDGWVERPVGTATRSIIHLHISQTMHNRYWQDFLPEDSALYLWDSDQVHNTYMHACACACLCVLAVHTCMRVRVRMCVCVGGLIRLRVTGPSTGTVPSLTIDHPTPTLPHQPPHQVVYGKEGHNAKLAAAFYCVPVEDDDDTPGA